ncbi:hypothetical protein EMCRGX_G017639 [Ephydatia muelleri]
MFICLVRLLGYMYEVQGHHSFIDLCVPDTPCLGDNTNVFIKGSTTAEVLAQLNSRFCGCTYITGSLSIQLSTGTALTEDSFNSLYYLKEISDSFQLNTIPSMSTITLPNLRIMIQPSSTTQTTDWLLVVSVCSSVLVGVVYEWLLNQLMPFLYTGNLLEYAGTCVTSCPVGYTSNGAKCVACSGVCPRVCTGTDANGVTAGNIGQFNSCTIVNGSLSISDSSIASGADLEVLSTIQEIQGFLRIESLTTLTSFPYLRNLKKIGFPGAAVNLSITGPLCQPGGAQWYSLVLRSTSLQSIDFSSLEVIQYGGYVLGGNPQLCYVGNFTRHLADTNLPVCLSSNTACRMDPTACSKYLNGDLCCLGPLCFLQTLLYCYSIWTAQLCVASCPLGTYANGTMCTPCYHGCTAGCAGPLPYVNLTNGCLGCSHVQFSADGKQLSCLSSCPANTYSRRVSSPQPLPPGLSYRLLAMLQASTTLCLPCHHLCASCSGPDLSDCLTCRHASREGVCLSPVEHTNEGHLGHLFGVAVTFSVTISVVVMVMFIVIVGGVICVRVRRSKSYSRLIHEGEELNIQEEGGTKETPVSLIWNKQMEVEKKVVQ